MTNKEAQIYIHIPFCVRKCAYCDFLSFPADEETQSGYTEALLREIPASGSALRGKTVRSVFFGGGTPSVLPARSIERIMNMLCRCFSIQKDAEITLECNPGTADRSKLSALKRCGVNRLSIGVQSFDDDLLKTIGRIHDRSEAIRCYEDARHAGFSNISLDLISALPGQTRENWAETLRSAAGLSPEHLSAYSLILEEGTPLYERREKLTIPDEEEDCAMYEDTNEILSLYGFEQYEISNYARPKRQCRHNTGYWTLVEYLGLGLGASSCNDGVRYKNTDDLREYLRFCETPKEQYKEIQKLTKEDEMTEFVILGLRMTKGISSDEFRERFGCALDEAFPLVCQKYKDLGLLTEHNGRIRFTRKGISLSNVVLAEFV